MAEFERDLKQRKHETDAGMDAEAEKQKQAKEKMLEMAKLEKEKKLQERKRRLAEKALNPQVSDNLNIKANSIKLRGKPTTCREERRGEEKSKS